MASRKGPGEPPPDVRKSKSGNVQIARDAKSGQFVPINQAKKRPSTTVVETIKRSNPPPAKPPKGKK